MSHDPHVHQFLTHVAYGRARSSSGGVAVRYVLPVLLVMLCFNIIHPWRHVATAAALLQYRSRTNTPGA